ncbi:MAG: vitamin B12 dependent methionine synthase, partial [Clostridiales bacterium]
MEATVLNNIPFQINIAQLLKNLDKQKFAYSEERVKELADIASSIGRPKAIYKEAYVENRDGDTLIIDGMKFSGRVISVNLAEVHKVVAYVITSGNELEEWSQSFDNDLDRAYLGAIKELVLLAALEFVYQEIDEKYNFPKASNMNPGSLKDWPLTEQNSLFA